MKMFEELLAKLQFWRAKKFLKLDEHYQFMLDLSNSDVVSVRILKKYPDVIVEFSNIHMSADNMMAYDLDVIANPNLCDTKSKKFYDFTASVFRSILLGSIEHAKEKNENRNVDTFESDSQRTLYEEVSSISEERVSERKPRKKTVRGNKKIHS